uniref:Myb-like domain-containing protein n=1 Tax=Aplanochytrium stocchinoi TaxID=215587 RepID=A0A7S3PNU3_9STRA|mmetsp:Transcript_17762/g.21880  ORF Transcript_17762/g.21880 Transcript_17762/m.21880 type:complete len:238 (+) Transcript_17762:134-847(+)
MSLSLTPLSYSSTMTLSGKLFQNDELLSTFMECTYGEPADEPAIEFYSKNNYMFIAEPTVEIPTTATAFEFEDIYNNAPKPLSMNKRKSEDWDSKPLEKRPATNNKCEFATLAREFSLDSELSQCSDRFVDMLLTETKPLAFDYNTLAQAKQKRIRWTDAEVDALWSGIEKYGNNWRAINQNCLPLRTYYQVKDKGRRCLTSNGWISGLPDTNEASFEAKRIAKRANTKKNAKARRS